jgi:hypothetical protein
MKVYSDFSSYKSGIYAHSSSASYDTLHSIAAIGYGIDTATNTKYFI